MEISHELNVEHATNPKLGDFWQEMFSPVAIVIDVDDQTVTTLEKVKATDRDHWTWDLDSRPVVYSREEFRWRWTYGRMSDPAFRGIDPDPGVKNKCWCDVLPQHHMRVIEYMKENHHGIETQPALSD